MAYRVHGVNRMVLLDRLAELGYEVVFDDTHSVVYVSPPLYRDDWDREHRQVVEVYDRMTPQRTGGVVHAIAVGQGRPAFTEALLLHGRTLAALLRRVWRG